MPEWSLSKACSFALRYLTTFLHLGALISKILFWNHSQHQIPYQSGFNQRPPCRRYITSSRSGLCKGRSWLSRLYKAVCAIPDAGACSPKAGSQEGRWEAASNSQAQGGTPQEHTDAWVHAYCLWSSWQGHPGEARALCHRVKHTHLAQEAEKLTRSRGIVEKLQA